MTTAAQLITSARYDTRDEQSTQYSDAMMLDYLNRGTKNLPVTLAMLRSDWVNDTETLTILDGDSEIALPTYFMSDITVLVGTAYLTKCSVSAMRDKQTSASTGDPGYYSIHKTNLLVDTLVDGDLSVVLEYNQSTALLLSGTSMPYNDEFNDVLRQFLVLMCKTRNEYTLAGDAAIQDFFYQALFSKVISRNHVPNVNKTDF